MESQTDLDEQWYPLESMKPDDLHVSIRLIDGTEIKLWSQFDGDFWYETLNIFIDESKVTHWKRRQPEEHEL